jgi:hypothetical protein
MSGMRERMMASRSRKGLSVASVPPWTILTDGCLEIIAPQLTPNARQIQGKNRAVLRGHVGAILQTCLSTRMRYSAQARLLMAAPGYVCR